VKGRRGWEQGTTELGDYHLASGRLYKHPQDFRKNTDAEAQWMLEIETSDSLESGDGHEE
jgi:hypothetical protein